MVDRVAVYAPALEETSREGLDEWLASIGKVRNGGDILKNVQEELQLSDSDYVSFLDAIGSTFAAENLRDPDCPEQALCESSLIAASRKHRLNGPPSKVGSEQLLHHVLRESNLKRLIFKVLDGLVDDELEAWDMFWDDIDDDDSRLELLDALACPPGRLLWASFSQDGSDSDPTDKLKAEEVCVRLGLSAGWYGYDFPSNMWKIHYKLTSDEVRYIPTVADSSLGGLNPFFKPCPYPRGHQDAKWGWTRPLGSPRSELGEPECIHEGVLEVMVVPERLSCDTGD